MTVDKSTISSLLSSSILVFAGTVLTAASSFFERIVVARHFSIDVYGEVSIGIAVMSTTVYLSMAGLNHGVPRYISRFDSDTDVRGIWLSGALIAAGLSVGVAVVLLSMVNDLAALLYDGTGTTWLLTLFVVAIPLTAALRMGIGTLRGFENTVYKFLVGDLLYPVLRLGLLLGLLAAGVGLAAAGYAYIIAGTIALVAVFILVNRLVPVTGPVNYHTRTLMVFSAPLMLSEIFAVLLTHTDLLLIGYFSTSEQAGLYSAAFALARTILYFVGSLSYLYLPLTSRLDADGDRKKINDLYRVTTKWGFIVSFPIFAVFVGFADDILAMSFGPEYRASSLAFIVLAVGFFSDAAFGRNRTTLKALGSSKAIMVGNVLALAVNLGLNFVLIPAFGLLGAAVASTASYLGLNVTLYVVLRRKYDVTPFASSLVRTYVVLSITLLPTMIAVGQIVSLSPYIFPVALVVAAFLTIVTVFVSRCLRPDDVIILEVIEDAVGVKIPYVRHFVHGTG